ncbi:MAG: hypothetical protein ACE5KH_01095 [Candidatus Geothermarchaeales archaeon]
MVSKRAVFKLMRLVWFLGYIYERCRSASGEMGEFQTCRVKGRGYMLDSLRAPFYSQAKLVV